MSLGRITACQLQARLASNAPPLILDVREPWEVETARLSGAITVPLAEVPARLDWLDPRREIVVLCHHGIRSRLAAEFLERSGFDSVLNLEGGIDAWAREVDSTVPTY